MQVKENTNVVQSNFLLENRPKLTKDETRLFLTIVGAINKDDDDFKPLEIPVSEFAELWGMESNAAYRKIKAALRGLRKKEFFIEGINPKTGKKRFLTTSSISAGVYEEGEGYATVEVSQLFKPYLLVLKKNYTRYVLKNILNLSTVNAIRNYELLKQYESLGSRAFGVEEYKKILGIEEKYSLNADLRRFVLDAAVEEINRNTDILISYEFIGRGKKAKITFTICPNEKKKTLPSSVAKSEAPDLTNDDFFDEDDITTEEHKYNDPYLGELALACDCEFDEDEISLLAPIIAEKVPGVFSRSIEYNKQRRYRFLQRAYAALNIADKKGDVKTTRIKYIEGVLSKMPALKEEL